MEGRVVCQNCFQAQSTVSFNGAFATGVQGGEACGERGGRILVRFGRGGNYFGDLWEENFSSLGTKTEDKDQSRFP